MAWRIDFLFVFSTRHQSFILKQPRLCIALARKLPMKWHFKGHALNGNSDAKNVTLWLHVWGDKGQTPALTSQNRKWLHYSMWLMHGLFNVTPFLVKSRGQGHRVLCLWAVLLGVHRPASKICTRYVSVNVKQLTRFNSPLPLSQTC